MTFCISIQILSCDVHDCATRSIFHSNLCRINGKSLSSQSEVLLFSSQLIENSRIRLSNEKKQSMKNIIDKIRRRENETIFILVVIVYSERHTSYFAFLLSLKFGKKEIKLRN